MKAVAFFMLASLALAGLVQAADVPPGEFSRALHSLRSTSACMSFAADVLAMIGSPMGSPPDGGSSSFRATHWGYKQLLTIRAPL